MGIAITLFNQSFPAGGLFENLQYLVILNNIIGNIFHYPQINI
jgi:hypothetical protein